MANYLEDGSVLPSYFESETVGTTESMAEFNNVSLKQGEVMDIILPSSQKSVSKKYIEYKVGVQYREGSGPAATVIFPNCVIANLFGGGADYFRYTVRPWSHEPEKGYAVSNGSKVLVLCINGSSQMCYIVGGIPELDKEPSDAGHFLKFAFNGIKSSINNDGEFKIEYTGANNNEGDLKDSSVQNNVGSYITFLKNGNIKLSTKDEKQFITLDQENQKILIQADQEWNVDVKGALKFTVQNEIDIKSTSSMCTLTASQNIILKSSGVKVGAATDAWVKGTTYRNAESTMNQTIMSSLSSLAGILTAVSASLATAATAIVASPATAGPPLATAATVLGTATSTVTSIISAISLFESGSTSYLSTVNLTD